MKSNNCHLELNSILAQMLQLRLTSRVSHPLAFSLVQCGKWHCQTNFIGYHPTSKTSPATHHEPRFCRTKTLQFIVTCDGIWKDSYKGNGGILLRDLKQGNIVHVRQHRIFSYDRRDKIAEVGNISTSWTLDHVLILYYRNPIRRCCAGNDSGQRLLLILRRVNKSNKE
jgi:hypothetical protein